MRWVSCRVLLALALGASGCAAETRGPGIGSGPGALAMDGGSPSAVATGAGLVSKRGCKGCHDPGDGSLSGRFTPVYGTEAYAPNLTPDPDTGLGGWTDFQLARAIRTGLDDEDAPLCETMPRFQMTDDDVAAVVAYLRSLKPVSREIPASSCPPLKGGDGPDAGAGVDAAVMVDGAAVPTCAPRVNELQTGGAAATDEFIELYNPCPQAVSLQGYALVYRAATGSSDVVLLTFGASTLLPGGFLVAANKAGTVPGDVTYAASLAATGGGVALRAPGGAVVDSLGWGTAANAFVRGAAAAAPPAGQAAARLRDGMDSGDNGRDFAVEAPTPGKPNA